MRRIKRTNGKESVECIVAQQTKRRLMMLPLLPMGLIGDEVLTVINDEWETVETYEGGEFLETIDSIRSRYVGFVKSNGHYKTPTFSPELWNSVL